MYYMVHRNSWNSFYQKRSFNFNLSVNVTVKKKAQQSLKLIISTLIYFSDTSYLNFVCVYSWCIVLFCEEHSVSLICLPTIKS